MINLGTLKRGLQKGIGTTWVLSKVMVPVYLAVTILSQTPIMDWLARLAKPLMGLMGLPGEAATPMVIGNVLNIYAAIGALGAIHLSPREVTVLAIVLLISHSLLVETAVSKQTGIKVTSLVLVRILGGLASGILLNWGWGKWL
ncbi:MAG TPA: nucleoside recognition domain-containing protein [Bacillota bacterium]|nr:nucleoside recognition domain-containing protein [Bacillota bacterium]